MVSIKYVLESNDDGSYTGYCPIMKPVRFSGKDRDRVITLVQKCIQMYIRHNPNVLSQLREMQEYVVDGE
ncbi:MAG: hypothetical protein OXP12_06930 [Thaumarchaeota archaeon]|nr:hypothetical protein [Nitrososphaerota archaeon]